MTPLEDYLRKENDTLKQLLRLALPYVWAHYERSRTGFGETAKNLGNKIKEILGIR